MKNYSYNENTPDDEMNGILIKAALIIFGIIMFSIGCVLIVNWFIRHGEQGM